MLKLIVHADDFGISENINSGIIRAYTDGILTSTSIMANGNAFQQAADLFKTHPPLDVGIHLTLIEGNPLLPKDNVPTLITSNGTFYPHAIKFMKKYLLRKISLEEIEKEFEAQFEKVLAAGINPSHIDSHQHIHILPGILPIVVKLSKKYNIPYIRSPHERIKFFLLKKMATGRLIQQSVLNCCCILGEKLIEKKSDYFAGFTDGGNLNKENLLLILQNREQDGLCEIMCHPGLADKNSLYNHWRYNWSEELNALLDADIHNFIRAEDIELVSYGDIMKIQKKCV